MSSLTGPPPGLGLTTTQPASQSAMRRKHAHDGLCLYRAPDDEEPVIVEFCWCVCSKCFVRGRCICRFCTCRIGRPL